MKLIFISDNGRHHKKFSIKFWPHFMLPLFMISLFTIAAMAAKNYYVNTENEIINKNEIKLLRKFDLLIQKTTSLEAQVQRLNLLSTTLANKTKVDIHSFQLNNEPALGGLDKSFYDDSEIVRESDLFKSIDVIDRRLSLLKARFSDIKNSIDRKGINNSHINNSKIEPDYSKSKSAFLSPVKQGYVSSSYGRRRDPINGHRRHHSGIDIAAQHGSEIHAIASGFVTFSGKKGGYGNVVEIHHSDSLKSRYAHLQKIDVAKGDVIRKGESIATMGSTGRATGPHLHLEIWENGKAVNPESYIEYRAIISNQSNLL